VLGAVLASLAVLTGVVWAASDDGEPDLDPPVTIGPTTRRSASTSGPISTQPPTTFRTPTVPPTTQPVPVIKERWNAPLGKMARFAGRYDRTVVVATTAGEVVELNGTDGAVRWRRRLSPAITGGVVVGRTASGKGVVVARVQDPSAGRGFTVALDAASGRELWRRSVERSSSIFDPPAAVGAGRVYIAEARLVALDLATGALRWAGPNSIEEAPAKAPVFAIGRLFIVTNGQRIKAYDAATGDPSWEAPASFTTSLSPSRAALLVQRRSSSQASSTEVSALDPKTGRVLWRHPGIPGDAFNPAMAIADLVVVVPGSEGLIALDLATGRRRWESVQVPPSAALGASGDDDLVAVTYKLQTIDVATGRVTAEGRLSEVSIDPPVPGAGPSVVIMESSVGGYSR